MLNSSLRKGEYSDSEVSDVTNALLDGANGFVLKDCNDLENYIDTIKSLNELCLTVEPYTNSKTNFWRVIDEVLFLVNRILSSLKLSSPWIATVIFFLRGIMCTMN